ncbi:MAG: hypothetical protein ACI9UT_000839, partial [Flavobacteriales bacterium]
GSQAFFQPAIALHKGYGLNFMNPLQTIKQTLIVNL